MKEIIEYYDNGNISRKYYEDDNGSKHGLYQSWYDNGQLDIKCHLINGDRHGLYQTWYSNGQLLEEAIFINGDRHGLYQTWYSNGQLLEEVIFINGEATSLQIPKSREEKILFKIKHGIEI